ncbi:MAG: sodium-dependent transporter [Erysipelotrichaceae bacterium]|nr:sodium-dependent transporter [Erysipelotrichaceae bacterium]
MEKKRSVWSSRATFILAAVGSAVGLGNAWRFPGLVAKHGGGAFLLVYIVALFAIGIPLLMMELAVARKFHKGAGESMRGINKKTEFIGWAATANASVIVTYYAIVFAWVIMMFLFSYKFIGMTGDSAAASNLFANLTQTTWDVTGYTIPINVLVCVVIAWIAIYYCIRNGASSVGKVVKYTVMLPVILLLIMAVKGCMMPGAMEGLHRLFIPNLEALKDPSLWVDAIGQVFYSLSIMMSIMFAYGSYLSEEGNIATDAILIAISDAAVSVLSGVVMFSTMGGVGMLDSMSTSGVATAFIIYPQAIVNLTSNGYVNAIFGAIFYLMLVTLAIDSAFSIVEGVSASVSDKFKLDPKKTTRVICCVAAVISLLYATRAGVAWLDIVDNWTNQINLIVIGVMECIAIGWLFDIKKVLKQVNRNTKKFKVPYWWFGNAIRYIAPISLTILFIWNIYDLFFIKGGHYGYALWAEVCAGWIVSALVFVSGFFVKKIVDHKKKNGFVENEIVWIDEEEEAVTVK